MISMKEFCKIIEEKATDFAKAMVNNPKEHPDKVKSIKASYIYGALSAYELLTSKNK